MNKPLVTVPRNASCDPPKREFVNSSDLAKTRYHNARLIRLGHVIGTRIHTRTAQPRQRRNRRIRDSCIRRG